MRLGSKRGFFVHQVPALKILSAFFCHLLNYTILDKKNYLKRRFQHIFYRAGSKLHEFTKLHEDKFARGHKNARRD